MITQYIRRRRKGQNQRVGILVGDIIDDRLCIGWSLCKSSDRFNQVEGMGIALDRMYKPNRPRTKFPADSIRDDVTQFEDRCHRYFKQIQVSSESGVA